MSIETIDDAFVEHRPFTRRGQELYWDAALPGFGLVCGIYIKSFIYKWASTDASGKRYSKQVTLGHWPSMTTQQARVQATKLREERLGEIKLTPHSREFEPGGHLWIARLPSGAYAILWRHPRNAGWHQQLQTCETEAEAARALAAYSDEPLANGDASVGEEESLAGTARALDATIRELGLLNAVAVDAPPRKQRAVSNGDPGDRT